MFSFFKRFKGKSDTTAPVEAPVEASPGEPTGPIDRIEPSDSVIAEAAALVSPAAGYLPNTEINANTNADFNIDVGADDWLEKQAMEGFESDAEVDDALQFEHAEVVVPPPAPEPTAKRSWLTRLKSGLSKTSSNLTGLFISVKVDETLYEELEGALLMSDAGIDATEFLLDALRQKVRAERLSDGQQVKGALRALLVELLRPLERSLVLGRHSPMVMMIAGVNGAGKTTSIGKLAKHLQRFDQKVLLAAGDTFRAAAREQLAIWGERNGITVVAQEGGDAAAVIFDAVGAARARGMDVLMADTAGRLPTQLHLMEELKKVKRVIGKAMDGAPHEILLVIDANTGQNALTQVKAFDDALGLTGLVVTKLDGTAKGGILAAIARQRPIPVYFIGVGEGVDDLQPFVAEEFADALLG
jgi:fused signal recognition particle receptor